MKFLKEKLLLSEKGYSDLKKAIVACTLTNIALLLPAGVTTLLFWQLLNPFYGKDISWGNMWGLLIGRHHSFTSGLPCSKNDYRKPIWRPIRRPAIHDCESQNICVSSL